MKFFGGVGCDSNKDLVVMRITMRIQEFLNAIFTVAAHYYVSFQQILTKFFEG